MDRAGIATSMTSPTLPAVGFLPPAEAAAVARASNEYARKLAELNAEMEAAHKKRLASDLAVDAHKTNLNDANDVAEAMRKAQQALLDTSHPLCMEYPAAAGGGVIRIFPTRGGGGAQVLSKQLDKHIETAKFLAAVGAFMPFALLRISL
jgi:hypothetical protein